MNVEVYYPKDGEWYQARVLTVNKRGQSKVAYINAEDQGEVTEQSQTELVTDRRRLRCERTCLFSIRKERVYLLLSCDGQIARKH